MSVLKSPGILDYSWGKISVEGYETPFKDVKLFPGGAEEWDWNITGTNHSRGIQLQDIKDLLEKGAGVIVISKGMLNRLRLSKNAKEFLKSHNIDYYHLNTKKAVEKYNLLKDSKPAGALIHTTC